jgi:hypothetical protein
MDIQAALEHDRTVDITTTGRRSGEPQRIEIWFHRVNGRTYITGLPGRRGWYANVTSDPAFTFHLKESAQADLPAHARPVTDPNERRVVLGEILPRIGYEAKLDEWLKRSPIIEVLLDADR